MRKICILINKEFDSEPVYSGNDKCIMSYGDKVKYEFSRQKIPKENASCKCLWFVMLDFTIRVSKKYYPETLLEECNYKKILKWSILLMMI